MTFQKWLDTRHGQGRADGAARRGQAAEARGIAQKQALADIMNHKPETAEQFYCKKHFTGTQESTNSA